MKIYSILIVCFLVLCCFAPYSALAAPAAASFSREDSLVVLSVTEDKVRMRSGPHVDSETVGRFDSGTILIAEKWPVKSRDMEWYRILCLADKDSGNVSDVLHVFPNLFHHPYVNTAFVQPYSGTLAVRGILEQIAITPYGEGYSGVDVSPEGQRKMAEQSPPQFVSLLPRKTPVYSQPSATSAIKGYYIEKNNEWFYNLVAVDSQPGWLLVVDLEAHGPSGWMREDDLAQYGQGDRSYHFEVGEQISLNLGANIGEIMRRWGPGKILERFTEEEWDEESLGRNSLAELAFEGLTVSYNNYRNYSFTLTRSRAGMGGIFVGVDWCDKAYIEHVFGKIQSKDVFTDEDGAEVWRLSEGLGSGWEFEIALTFDAKGLVSKFTFACRDAA